MQDNSSIIDIAFLLIRKNKPCFVVHGLFLILLIIFTECSN